MFYAPNCSYCLSVHTGESGFFDEAAVRQKTKELLAKFEGGKIKDAIKKAKDVVTLLTPD